MRTQIGLVSGPSQWMLCALIVVVATAGKFGGAFVAGRLSGMEWSQSAGLGILMNTRGLMELIVLNAGLDLGVISPTLFTMMVLMALITTIATTPVLHALGIGTSAEQHHLRHARARLDPDQLRLISNGSNSAAMPLK
jgi:Kef-type K+ transport system membrane component KefB